jgi:hypothetical protein
MSNSYKRAIKYILMCQPIEEPNFSSEKPKEVGFWKSKSEPSLPFPIISKNKNEHSVEFINKCNEWIKLTDTIKKYEATLKLCTDIKDKRFGTYLGCSKCRICGIINGDSEYNYNGFIFPEGIFHYIVNHNIEIDNDFKDMILKSELLDYKSLKLETYQDKIVRVYSGMGALRYE